MSTPFASRPALCQCRAFTLIELLLVVTVISILLSLLLPAVALVRESALQLKCAGNLRQNALAMQAYTEDFRGRLPTIKRNHGIAPNATTYIWMQLITPYAEASKNGDASSTNYRKNSVIDGCPKYRTSPKYDTLNMGYGMSIFLLRDEAGGPYVNGLDFDDTPLFSRYFPYFQFREFRTAALSKISDRVLVADRDNGATTGSDLWSGLQMGFRHRAYANMLMCDLHYQRSGTVASMASSDPTNP
jgi:prepilin-type N-terminal cleavage/methylation domain-containing protein